MEKQYRDESKRDECRRDELSISGSTIRIGSARTCVELAQRIEESGMASSFTVPCLVMVALEDVVVNPQGAIDFYDACQSTDKTIKKYPALHGLLCEPEPLCETIEKDLLEWIQQRT
jgi:acylglycerol lipase